MLHYTSEETQPALRHTFLFIKLLRFLALLYKYTWVVYIYTLQLFLSLTPRTFNDATLLNR
jgi:hypothetical protein